MVPQLKHSVPLKQPEITEVMGQRKVSEAVSWHRPGIDKRLELLPCEFCWVVVKELLISRQPRSDVCRGGSPAFGDGHLSRSTGFPRCVLYVLNA